MKENRLKKVFDILVREKDFCPVKNIASQMGVSEKTIIRDIEMLRDVLAHQGAEVISKPSKGYKIQVRNPEKFRDFVESDSQPLFEEDLNSSQQRIRTMIELLLSQKQMKAEDVSIRLGISRSTFNQDIKKVKQILKKYHLSIQSKPYYGMQITGGERSIRELMFEYLLNDPADGTGDSGKADTKRALERIILESLQEAGCRITEFSLRNLIGYLYIMLMRVRQGCCMDEAGEQVISGRRKESEIARGIAACLEREFKVTLLPSEVVFLTEHLMSQQIMKDEPMENRIPEEIDRLVEKILKDIKMQYHIDFTNNLHMRISMGLHIHQMVERAKYNLFIKNPVLYEMKGETFAYELAVYSSKIINEECHVTLSEHEIGYIAMYFGGALLRINQEEKRKNVLIVCGTGNSTAMLLKNKFEIEFSNHIAKLDTCDVMELENRDLNDYQLLVSTVPIHLKTDIPIIYINSILKSADASNIREHFNSGGESDHIKDYFSDRLFFSNIRFGNKQELLHWVSQRIGEEKKVDPEIYYQELLSREALSSTELDKKVAIPHPLNTVIEETFIVVVLLDEPLLWEEKKVQLVVLLNINPVKDSNIQAFYNAVTDLISDDEKIRRVLEARDLDGFIKVLTQ